MLSKESLKSLYLELDHAMRDSYDRSLPFDEYIFDRFERGIDLKAGEKTSIHHSCYIYGKPEIGANTWIGPFTVLDASGGLSIGNNCSISAGVHIYSHDTLNKRLSGGAITTNKASVKIGKSCYLGPQSVIGRGVELGDFCVVGANSYVSKSFPPYSVILGTPGVLKGKVKFNQDGTPYIDWLPKDNNLPDLIDKINRLEERIRELEKI